MDWISGSFGHVTSRWRVLRGFIDFPPPPPPPRSLLLSPFPSFLPHSLFSLSLFSTSKRKRESFSSYIFLRYVYILLLDAFRPSFFSQPTRFRPSFLSLLLLILLRIFLKKETKQKKQTKKSVGFRFGGAWLGFTHTESTCGCPSLCFLFLSRRAVYPEWQRFYGDGALTTGLGYIGLNILKERKQKQKRLIFLCSALPSSVKTKITNQILFRSAI